MTHMEFLPDHPVEEVGRLLLSVLIKHLGLASHVLRVIDRGRPSVARSTASTLLLRGSFIVQDF